MTILSEIIQILVGGITGIAQGVGSGLSTLATSIFLTGTGENQSLSTFGILIVVFAGIGLSIGLCRLVVRWLCTLGGRKV